MESLSLCFRMEGQRHYPTGHIVNRHHVDRLVLADRQASQFAMQHQFQHIIDGIEIAGTSCLGVSVSVPFATARNDKDAYKPMVWPTLRAKPSALRYMLNICPNVVLCFYYSLFKPC